MMTPVPFLSTRLLLLLLLLLLSAGCSARPSTPSGITSLESESVDPSCAYFYFLWGNNAEYRQNYEEALEAYEKAAICDPDADYVAEKIPVLLIQLGKLAEAADWLERYIADRPQKTVQRFMLARLKIQNGEEDEAIKLYREALNLEPDNNTIRLRLGLLYSKKGEFEIAENIFKTILERDPDSYFARLYLARMYVSTGQAEQAEKFYLEALELNWSKELSYEIADFYTLRKQFHLAQDIYQDILLRDERDERAALGMVQTYLLLERGDAALRELARIRPFSDNPERIDLVRSQILINTGEYDQARRILQRLLEDSSLSQARYLLAVVHYEQGNFAEALAVLQEIAPEAPEFSDAVMLQVRIHEESGNSDRSLALLRKLIADEQHRQPVFYSWLAAIEQNEDRIDTARQVLAEGVRRYPEDESLLYEYAIVLEKVGRHEEAMELMEKILSLNLNHADALNFIGYSLADRNVQLQKAYEYIRRALAIKPDSGYILDSLGWVYYRLGSYEKARTELEKAARHEPQDPYVYDHLGDAYRALQEDDKAVEAYRKSLQLLPDEEKQKRLEIEKKIEQINEP